MDPPVPLRPGRPHRGRGGATQWVAWGKHCQTLPRAQRSGSSGRTRPDSCEAVSCEGEVKQQNCRPRAITSLAHLTYRHPPKEQCARRHSRGQLGTRVGSFCKAPLRRPSAHRTQALHVLLEGLMALLGRHEDGVVRGSALLWGKKLQPHTAVCDLYG